MKQKWFKQICIASVAGLLATPAYATIIASDSFVYTAPGNLIPGNGGVGFSNAWTTTGMTNPALATGSMTYSDTEASAVVTAGNKIQPAINSQATRNLTSTITTAGKTFWFGFRGNQTGASMPSNHAGFSVSNGTTGIFMGKPGFSATNWGIDIGGVVAQKSGAATAADKDAFLLYKLSFTGTQVTVSMWVDPPVLREESLPAPQASLTANYTANISQIRFSTGGNATGFQFDELRFGTDLWDAAPTGVEHDATSSALLTTALANCNRGDRILLTPNTTYSGTFVLRNITSGNGWVTIQSKSLSSLPGYGDRVDLGDASLMPKINAGATAFANAIRTNPTAHHFRLIGLEVTGPTVDTGPNNANITYEAIRLGDAGAAQDTSAEVPHHFVIDRCIVRALTDAQRIKRGLALNSASTDVTNSYFSNWKAVGQDSQAINGWNGPGPYNLINNFLEGSTENVLFGGSDPSIPNLVPSDIVIKRNHFFKRMSWKSGQPGFTIQWSVKNIYELKNARNVMTDGNIFENCWVQGQAGDAIVFTPRNQDDTAPWCVVEDVTFKNNIVRRTNNAVNMIAYDDEGATSQQTNNMVFENNLFYEIGGSAWGGGGDLFKIAGDIPNWVVNHNTAFFPKVISTVRTQPNTAFVFTNNVMTEASGFHSATHSTNEVTLDFWYPSCTFQKNVLQGAESYTFTPNYAGGWSSTAIGFPASWSTVLGNQASPGTNFAGWKVLGWDQPTNFTTYPYNNAATDGTDVGANIDVVYNATLNCISGDW